MARPAAAVIDATALTAAKVDARARVGWTLRMSRLATHTTGMTMATRLAELGLRVSQPTISAVENGSVPPSTDLVRGYEQALSVPPGSLRGMVAMLTRTFGAPPIRRNRPVDLATLSERYDRVTSRADTGPSGGDWLDLTEVMTNPESLTPVAVVRPLVDTLQSELARSVGTAYLARYEALTQMRTSAYLQQVEDSVAAAVTTPYAMAVVDRIVVLAERHTPSTFDLLAGWLNHPDASVARGAAVALINFRTPGHSRTVNWAPLVAPYVEAYNARAEDARRHEPLSMLFRNLPSPIREQIQPRLNRPIAALNRPQDWTTTRRNHQFEQCIRLADAITDALAVPEQPMLARLLFEAVFDFRPDRQFTSAMTLGLLPCHDLIAEGLVDLADTTTDPGTQQGVLNLAMSLSGPASERVARAWLDSSDDAKQVDALVAAAHAGLRLSRAQLEEFVSRAGLLRERAAYAAGMTGHPILRTWAERTSDKWLQGTARWWRNEGPAVTT